MTNPASLIQMLRLHVVCPNCRGTLDIADESILCPNCHTTYPLQDGIYDFAPGVGPQPGFGQRVMESRIGARLYEDYLRMNFVRVMGQNWDGGLTPEAEDAYLVCQVTPVEVPILDLACGAGRWTHTLVETFGAERVIGLDLSSSMLKRTRRLLSEVLLLRADAARLPFADASLGAVNCSNSLQLFPDPEAVIAEVGRCLKPGGTFTFFTFRKSPSPAYRLLQRACEELNRVKAFQEDDLRAWLSQAGLRVTDLGGPNLIILGTAER